MNIATFIIHTLIAWIPSEKSTANHFAKLLEENPVYHEKSGLSKGQAFPDCNFCITDGCNEHTRNSVHADVIFLKTESKLNRNSLNSKNENKDNAYEYNISRCLWIWNSNIFVKIYYWKFSYSEKPIFIHITKHE